MVTTEPKTRRLTPLELCLTPPTREYTNAKIEVNLSRFIVSLHFIIRHMMAGRQARPELDTHQWRPYP